MYVDLLAERLDLIRYARLQHVVESAIIRDPRRIGERHKIAVYSNDAASVVMSDRTNEHSVADVLVERVFFLTSRAD